MGSVLAYAATYRVVWVDFRGHHDFVGRFRLPKSADRVKPPPRHHRDFRTRGLAEQFVAQLRREIPKGEVVTQIISLGRTARPVLKEQLLPGLWPLQRRG